MARSDPKPGYVLSSEVQRYLSRIEKEAHGGSEKMETLLTMLRKSEQHGCKVLYFRRPDRSIATKSIFDLETPAELIKELEIVEFADEDAVCVIENISPAFILELGAVRKIPPDFFAEYVRSPKREGVWVSRAMGVHDSRVLLSCAWDL